MIIEVAIGVVLGFIILANLRELLALGFVVVIIGLALLLAVAGGVVIFEWYQGVKEVELVKTVISTLNSIWSVIGTSLVFIIFALMPLEVVTSRTNLRGKEAYVFSGIFAVLFLGSISALAWSFPRFLEGNAGLLDALIAISIFVGWASAFIICTHRSRQYLKPENFASIEN